MEENWLKIRTMEDDLLIARGVSLEEMPQEPPRIVTSPQAPPASKITAKDLEVLTPPKSVPAPTQPEGKARSRSKTYLSSLILIILLLIPVGYYLITNPGIKPVFNLQFTVFNRLSIFATSLFKKQKTAPQSALQKTSGLLPPPEAPESATQSVLAAKFSDSFIDYTNVKIIEVLPDALKPILTEPSLKDRAIKRLIITQESSEVALKELFNSISIKYTPELLDSLSNGYNVFYSSGAKGNRLGLILETKNASGARLAITKAEKTLLDDFSPLFEDQKPQPPYSFSETIYRGSYVRYINNPFEDLTLDWAILKGRTSSFLIISTSKEALFTVLDQLASGVGSTPFKQEIKQEISQPATQIAPSKQQSPEEFKRNVY